MFWFLVKQMAVSSLPSTAAGNGLTTNNVNWFFLKWSYTLHVELFLIIRSVCCFIKMLKLKVWIVFSTFIDTVTGNVYVRKCWKNQPSVATSEVGLGSWTSSLFTDSVFISQSKGFRSLFVCRINKLDNYMILVKKEELFILSIQTTQRQTCLSLISLCNVSLTTSWISCSWIESPAWKVKSPFGTISTTKNKERW